VDWSRFREPRRIDAAIALSFALALQLEVWIWWVESEQGPKPLAAVAGLLMTLPLVWRRRAPRATFAAIMAAFVVWTLIDVPQGSLVPFLVQLVIVYSVAVQCPKRDAAAALVIALAAEVLFVVRTTNSFGDYAFILAFVGAAWGAGRGIRARQQRADELFARAVRLEVDREERARAAVEEERSRIARELHDIISHSVSVMVVQAGAAEQVLDQDREQARDSLRSIQETGRQARVELRRLLGLLRSDREGPELAPQPGVGQIHVLIERMRRAGLDIELSLEGEPKSLAPGLDLSAYRIVQEALTNALKHGGPGRARVAVCYGRDAIEVEVVDEGAADVKASAGHGLVGMQERIALYGGELEHGRRDGGGYRLRARLPLEGSGQ
jgi:signal transduction histidine kinase